ncbi:MAG TPA: hypothetical protein VII22_22180 [Streptosporangiaceae bacterium]
MIGIYTIIAAILVAAGIAFGIIIIVSLGIHREKAAERLTPGRPGRLANGARVVNGLYVR